MRGAGGAGRSWPPGDAGQPPDVPAGPRPGLPQHRDPQPGATGSSRSQGTSGTSGTWTQTQGGAETWQGAATPSSTSCAPEKEIHSST